LDIFTLSISNIIFHNIFSELTTALLTRLRIYNSLNSRDWIKMNIKKQIYLAGPLFSKGERDFNILLRNRLVKMGFSVFLPQEDGNDTESSRHEERQKMIFENDIRGIDRSDILLAVLDGGSDVDSGTAWEMGYAYARGIPVLGLKTDFRTFGEEGIVNLMMEMSMEALERDIESITNVLGKYLDSEDIQIREDPTKNDEKEDFII